MSAKEHEFAYLRRRADVLKCCGEEKNLFVRNPLPNVWIAHCKVCLRKHRKVHAEPGSAFGQALQAMAPQERKVVVVGG